MSTTFQFVYYFSKSIAIISRMTYNKREVKKMGIELLNNYNNLYDSSERKQMIAQSMAILRKSKNLQMKEVAELIGISQQAYGAYERGRNEPPAEILVRLSMLYDVSIDIIVQKDNMSKDKMALKKQLEQYEEQIQLLKAKLLEGDPEAQKTFGEMLEQMQNLTDAIKATTDS